MEKLITDMVAQAPAVAVMLYLVVRLDTRLSELQDVIIELIRSERDDSRA
jgi:hypothetical protein